MLSDGMQGCGSEGLEVERKINGTKIYMCGSLVPRPVLGLGTRLQVWNTR